VRGREGKQLHFLVKVETDQPEGYGVKWLITVLSLGYSDGVVWFIGFGLSLSPLHRAPIQVANIVAILKGKRSTLFISSYWNAYTVDFTSFETPGASATGSVWFVFVQENQPYTSHYGPSPPERSDQPILEHCKKHKRA
jgi:hypothetical protein